ncbi:hypothetical protein HHK36_009547 [Tetracentron sinense]|uniref:RNA helicase n=1 Tax=Tetracentron sinense TaxID=13715 RepID=A0A835DLQ4_TETSI|nr:hypothetical protein HHK36_009547 [Tetracentron sinense]
MLSPPFSSLCKLVISVKTLPSNVDFVQQAPGLLQARGEIFKARDKSKVGNLYFNSTLCFLDSQSPTRHRTSLDLIAFPPFYVLFPLFSSQPPVSISRVSSVTRSSAEQKMRRGVSPTTFAQEGRMPDSRRGVLPVPANFRSVRAPFKGRRDVFPANFRGERPQQDRPNFVVEIVSGRRGFRKAEAEDLIGNCKSKPDKFFVYSSGLVAGKLFFDQWSDALEAMVFFWERRLDGAHLLTPRVISNVFVVSDMDELRERLKALFADRAKILERETARQWQKKLELASDEIAKISSALNKHQRLGAFDVLTTRRKQLIEERKLISKRVKEFKSAMGSIIVHLGGNSPECCDEGVEVFRFHDDLNWSRIHYLMLREQRRLEDGLPIYAYRLDILREIRSQQAEQYRRGDSRSLASAQFKAELVGEMEPAGDLMGLLDVGTDGELKLALVDSVEGLEPATGEVPDVLGEQQGSFNVEARGERGLVGAQEVMVLVGETGSGKSTQLVQFLADSGVAADGSIVCTQPRKIAAISLAQRVGEESSGCCEDNSVICYPAYSSAQGFKSKIIFMTDHCLLQHYMNDKNLSRISCIIVDEAHERSLNTDLLLALVKNLLLQRLDLRLIIMSATADANKLSDYFFDCGIFHVAGRNFPVDIKYVPSASEGSSDTLKPHAEKCASYVSGAIKMATEIHKTEGEGDVLVFLTSQMEVEWACENFQTPSAVALALHGKLSYEEQGRVFQNYSEKRKVIFATNLAETSLTIPGIKYVIDSGMVKESRFEPSTGMNVLRVCRISKSSANQRKGRAGRTEPGKCYRLYSECDFQSMPSHQEPEIRRVHLGVAALRILALGIKNVQEFDFIDAPSAKAIDMAIRNLIQLGAITCINDAFEFTKAGRDLVKLGIEPRLGKLILDSIACRLHREGLVLAAVMANASSIFCRVGNDEDKQKSDCLKVQFCHRDGDLFTLLSVYKEWEEVPQENKNKWCWDNSINAKSMRRCKETMLELEHCLKNELSVIIPSYWLWNPHVVTEHDKNLKKIILSSLAENVAMYSGYDRLGYEVALTGQHVQLHPSCSLLIYGQKPSWVVFGELLSITNQYLVCVTAFDYECLSTIFPRPLFDVPKMETRRLHVRVMTGFGSYLLRRFCGRSNNCLLRLVSRVQTACMDKRIGIEVDVDKREIQLFASSEDMEKVFSLVNNALEYERKWFKDECMEKCLYRGGNGVSPSVALFGAGAEIKHLELEKRYLTVDVFLSDASALDDKELLMIFDKCAPGISGFHKFAGVGQDGEDTEKWGRITFLTPEAAEKAVAELNEIELSGSLLRVSPSRIHIGGDYKMFSFPAVRAKVFWPRRYSKGFAIVRCARLDADFIIRDFSNLEIGGRFVNCENSTKYTDAVVISGLDRETSEPEILDALLTATNRRILDVFLVRGDAVNNPPHVACEEALLREIAPFMPNKNPLSTYCRVQVFPPEPKDYFMKALITFDGRLHLEAAKALQHIQGKVLTGCLLWQKIQCQQMFHSSVSCPAPVYFVIKKQLDSLFESFKHRNGVSYNLERNENGSYRVRISANATKTVAELRKPLEQLMKGKTISHACLIPSVLQLLFSRDGIGLMKSLQKETGAYILYDKQNLNVRVFGPHDKVAVAERRLVESLLILHENKQLEIHLRGGVLPHDLMKELVKKFGPDLHGLKEKVPGVEFTLITRRHVISVRGNKEVKQKVDNIIYETARSLSGSGLAEQPECEVTCPICLCEVEDCYQLEACPHEFCRLCLVEQCESAMKSHDGFPICCAHEGCGTPIFLADLRALLSAEKLEELFRSSLGAFVALSAGMYRFCPSPDCPSVYRAADPATVAGPFSCGACYVETCTRCHLEYHPYVSCERYKEFKEDPDSSLREWCKGKEQVKSCPVCGYMIEKVDGCNHIECKCGKHICWVCLECYSSSDDCYGHLRSVHLAII